MSHARRPSPNDAERKALLVDIRACKDLNAQDEAGRTPLMVAIREVMKVQHLVRF